ncbi:MAG: FAD-binding oxidoreductase, partial [Alicyclobacillaceae bacterium]|nr:FAD-binding oxidoreductase [Alicyclobacillaceae bacterium]
GRVYLTKDAVLAPDVFAAMYPRLDRFREIKRKVDPDNRFSSSLARRLRIVEGDR